MLPIIDYGSIAVVVANVSAVGRVVEDEGKFGFQVFLIGKESPILIFFENADDADSSRQELIGIIAQYYYTKEFGPDFELEDILDSFEEDFDEGDDSGDPDENLSNDDKHEH